MRAGRVDAEHHIEPLRLFVDRGEARVAEHMAPVRRQHPAHVAELADGAPELLRRGLGVLDRQERHRLEPRAHADELFVEQRVVGAAEPDRPLAVLQKAHEEPERREEHHLLHAAPVEGFEPLLGVPGPVVELVDEPPVPAVRGVPGEGERAPAIGLVEVLRELLVGLGHMAVGVEHRHRRFLPLLFMASCRSR